MTLSHSPNIVRDGLVLYLDAANEKSYPGTGTTWYDLSGSNANAESSSPPTFISNGPQSYWSFDGVDDRFNSVNISQEYRDLFILHNLSSSAPEISMIFGHYLNQDDSLRFISGSYRSSTDFNDWQHNTLSDTFVNGKFDAKGTNVQDRWCFGRVYRSNTSGFGTSFRYEISSDFGSRRFKGNIALIMCYKRKLTNAEVLQNFNALRGRYGI